MTPRLTDFVKAYDVRGLVPEQLNADVARALGSAFVEVIAGPAAASAVVIGHDMRPSSPELSMAFADGVSSAGLDVIVLGLASTDALYYASGALDLPGAMFTASHNPAQYNGIKLCRAAAAPVGQDTGLAQMREVAQAILDGDREPVIGTSTGLITDREILGDYGRFLRSLVDLSSSRPLKVVVDAGNGMGGLTVPSVLGTEAGLDPLPLEIVPLYFELDGSFPNHEANPLEPENLRDLQAAVVQHGADLGLAFDGDADRCFVIDETGAAVTPSAITALIAQREIAREVAAGVPAEQIRIVHNVITSASVPALVADLGAVPVRTRVGHSFIKAEMAAHGAVFGGEHSAHYYFRDFWFADTGLLAAMHVLAALGEQPQPLSQVMTPYAGFAASGELNSTVADVAAATSAVRRWCDGQQVVVDDLDGLTVTHAGGPDEAMWWFNLRPSNTEPLLRLNVEAQDMATMERVRDDVLTIVRGTR